MAKKRPDADSKIIFERLKEQLSFNKGGYRVQNILDPYLNYIVFKNPSRAIIFRSALKKFLLIPGFNKMPRITVGTLFTFPEWTHRKDYKEILEYVSKDVTDKYKYQLSGLSLKPAFSFSNLKLAIKNTRYITELSWRDKFYLTAALYNVLLMIDDAEKHLSLRAQNYVSFCCVTGVENLLTQYFQKHSTPTYNLQHGITFVYQKNSGDELEYRNLITDNHLAWGDYTRNELIKYGIDPSKIHTAGYPRKITPAQLKAPANNQCLVLLSRKDFQAANIKLLTILARFNRERQNNFSFHLKLHPSLNGHEVRNIINDQFANAGFRLLSDNLSLHETFKESAIDFCIVVNSTAYYECYIHGIPALRLKDDSFDISLALMDDGFETSEEFSLLITRLYEDFEKYFNNETIMEGLNYIMGINKNEYAQLINRASILSK